MTTIYPGRYTAELDEPIVVFVIGMRINNLLKLRKWVPTFQAMGPMLGVLFSRPEKGFLGMHTWYGWGQIMSVQYWRSFEDLEGFARSLNDPHIPAWRRYNQEIGTDGSVGIWHETYLIEPGRFEAIYGNMPLFGMAAATRHVPAKGHFETARRRVGGQNEPAVPSPE